MHLLANVFVWLAEFTLTVPAGDSTRTILVRPTDIKTAAAARDFCQSQGGDLVTIQSLDENSKILEAIAKAVGNRQQLLSRVWSGAYSNGGAPAIFGKWTGRSTGRDLSFPGKWVDGTPPKSNVGQELCSTFNLHKGDWEPSSCQDQFAIMCQIGRLYVAQSSCYLCPPTASWQRWQLQLS